MSTDRVGPQKITDERMIKCRNLAAILCVTVISEKKFNYAIKMVRKKKCVHQRQKNHIGRSAVFQKAGFIYIKIVFKTLPENLYVFKIQIKDLVLFELK